MGRIRGEEGYTIIEIMIVMFILLAVLGAIGPWLYTNLNQSVRTQGRLESVEQARGVLRQMARELRQATAVVNATDNPSGAASLSFYADLNGDGVISSCADVTVPPECLTYMRTSGGAGKEIIRGRKKDQGNVVGSNVTSLTFDYFGHDPEFDANGDGLLTMPYELVDFLSPIGLPDDLGKVRMIKVSITVESRGQKVTVTQNVGLRNLNKIANNQ